MNDNVAQAYKTHMLEVRKRIQHQVDYLVSLKIDENAAVSTTAILACTQEINRLNYQLTELQAAYRVLSQSKEN